MRAWLRWFSTFGVVAVLVALALYFALGPKFGHASLDTDAHHQSPRKRSETVAITVEPVTLRPVRRIVSVVGSLYGREEIAVIPRVEGRVVSLKKDVGDVVKPGDVLCEIDATEYRLAVDEQERGLELELSKLGLKTLPVAEFPAEQVPMVVRAGFQLRNATSRLNRVSQLGGSVADEERDQAKTDQSIAEANLNQAKLDVATTLAAARQRHAALEIARQRLRDCVVKVPVLTITADHTSPAPVELSVASRHVAEGETLRTAAMGGTAAFRLVIDRPLKLLASVPERYLRDVSVGQPVELEIEAYPGERFPGTVARVSPAVDRGTRTFAIEVAVPNEARKLRPGSFAKTLIVAKAADRALTVPEEAVIAYAGVVKVFSVAGDQAVEVPVRLGTSLSVAGPNGKSRVWVEVIGDLKAGQPIVTSGQSRLSPGQAVRVRESPPPGNTAPGTNPPGTTPPGNSSAPAASIAQHEGGHA